MLRFWQKVQIMNKDECWPWMAGTYGKDGYGAFRFNKKSERAHRVSYILTYGGIPEGKLIRHACHNRLCCNPSHLVVGSNMENIYDNIFDKRKFGGRGKGRLLSDDEVKKIRIDTRSNNQIAMSYGVGRGVIWSIKNNKSYKELI